MQVQGVWDPDLGVLMCEHVSADARAGTWVHVGVYA